MLLYLRLLSFLNPSRRNVQRLATAVRQSNRRRRVLARS